MKLLCSKIAVGSELETSYSGSMTEDTVDTDREKNG